MTDGRITPTRRRRRRRREQHHANSGIASPAQSAGAAAGTPRFLRPPKAEAADHDSAAEREARAASSMPGQASERPAATPLGRAAAAALEGDRSVGKPLHPATRREGEAGLGAELDAVSVHPESPLAAGFGANAITYGRHIHFAPGAYRPGTKEGDALINHELAHVAQQDRFGAEGAQFDLMVGGMSTGLGWFDIGMAINSDARGRTGLDGTITFTPDPNSPYSNCIGLIQTLDLDQIDAGGAATDRSWAGTGEANRENVKTPEGEHVDMLHANQPDTRESEPWYWQGMSGDPEVPTAMNHFGWNRGDGDLHDARLYDFPKSAGHRVYDFETVAVGRDSEVVYGALNWGFEVDGAAGTVTNEYVDESVVNTSGPDAQHQSEAFDAAREEFRDFYIHEPEVVYFDTDQAAPQAGELDKLADAATYLAENPDVDIQLAGSADTSGKSGHNQRLALRRMDAVATHLISQGVSPDRIHRNNDTAGESSAQGGQGALAGSAGSLQANRRVTVTYQRMVSMP